MCTLQKMKKKNIVRNKNLSCVNLISFLAANNFISQFYCVHQQRKEEKTFILVRLYWSHESKRLETKFGHTHASHPEVTISLRERLYFIRGDALLIFIECYLVPAHPFIRTISFCIRTELEENIYYKDIKQSQKKKVKTD